MMNCNPTNFLAYHISIIFCDLKHRHDQYMMYARFAHLKVDEHVQIAGYANDFMIRFDKIELQLNPNGLIYASVALERVC